MLSELHVRNLALIEKADVEFGQGFNVLTGETGAGKSIIIGSVTIALGGKTPKDIIRKGAEYAYIELIFSVRDLEKVRLLKEMDVYPDGDGTVIISKKIMPSRSLSKINDETVTAGKLRDITGLLIDIHGQHEHQSLLYKSKHLEILDRYQEKKSHELKENIAVTYGEYVRLKDRLSSFRLDEESRLREMDFIRYEIEEIENARLKEGEKEELSSRYRLFLNAKKITESLSIAYSAVDSDFISRALKEVESVASYDDRLSTIRDQLFDADSILSDINREITSYMDDLSFDEEEYSQMEERLDVIHNLEAKYGGSLDQIFTNREEKQNRLEELEDYDGAKKRTEEEFYRVSDRLEHLSERLSEMRKHTAKELTEKIKEGLNDLNFIDVEFSMEFSRLGHYTAGGFDEAEFLISTNPGEPLKPLGMVASGGELSRIMLAIKTVLADTDDIPTLIFDEIDTGISGRTAQKVSEKLAYIAGNHQVICITHLPQIAAMADCHYEIAKAVEEGRTATSIHRLTGEEVIEELARLLGGAEITQAVRANAREMKRLAKEGR
ncbi:DNA repair protein RecN [Lacrimispora saccharolytica]|uniref:DNA repair protein RecN n=1 Tax=Lacrimispora saccharolytica (strain ATCC 35040 / DSM 2544 / NRCC 2533 / WM1) TaxID=610130 RepID=D9R8N2_LACSW|nr:DNA repair protein RecN [Lacrimispora saccharolytica]ADL05761.1 DNA repair protein RecN [[Clostridium] saccharolyticum WM1]QRV20098.1 DNA repair protein RecN [Lacrimispora saccharolytica]